MRTLVIAPHADDESLGCGGTLLRRRSEGSAVGWLLVTEPRDPVRWPSEYLHQREQAIERTREALGVDSQELFQLGVPAAGVTIYPRDVLLASIREVVDRFEPTDVLIPHAGDAHSDHRAVHEAAFSAVKWFRAPSVRRVMSYEVVSETDFGPPNHASFRPNVFVDISDYLEAKIRLLDSYAEEMGEHPFPRSQQSVVALATLRGAHSGSRAAEAFELVWQAE